MLDVCLLHYFLSSDSMVAAPLILGGGGGPKNFKISDPNNLGPEQKIEFGGRELNLRGDLKF